MHSRAAGRAPSRGDAAASALALAEAALDPCAVAARAGDAGNGRPAEARRRDRLAVVIAGERRRRVDREPADRAGAVSRLAQDEADRVEAVGEVVRDDGDEDEQPGLGREPEGEPDAEAVDEAVHREARRAEHAHLGVRVDVRVVVAMV